MAKILLSECHRKFGHIPLSRCAKLPDWPRRGSIVTPRYRITCTNGRTSTRHPESRITLERRSQPGWSTAECAARRGNMRLHKRTPNSAGCVPPQPTLSAQRRHRLTACHLPTVQEAQQRTGISRSAPGGGWGRDVCRRRAQRQLSLPHVVDGLSQDARGLLWRVEAVRVLRLDEVNVELSVSLELERGAQRGACRADLKGQESRGNATRATSAGS